MSHNSRRSFHSYSGDYMYGNSPLRRQYDSDEDWERFSSRRSSPSIRRRGRGRGRSPFNQSPNDSRSFDSFGTTRNHSNGEDSRSWDGSEEDYINKVESITPLAFHSVPPFQQVEDRGLSKTFMISNSSRSATINTTHPEWDQTDTVWSDGTVLKLLTIHASEYSVNKDGKHTIRLMCPNRPPPVGSNIPEVQFRWLHLQRPFLDLGLLEKWVRNSPFIDHELKIVVMNVLMEVKEREPHRPMGIPRPEPGCILRGIRGYDTNGSLDSRSVIFFSSPYLLLGKKPSSMRSGEGHHMLSLLESLYGYDVDSDRKDTEVTKRMNIGSSNETLHVPQLWCLLVGNDILITLSKFSAYDLSKDLVELDEKSSGLRRPLTIKVTDQDERPYSIVIDANCSYVDFLGHVYALAHQPGTPVTDYELLDEYHELVTPQKWLLWIQQGCLEGMSFYIVPKALHKQRMSRGSRSQSRSRSRKSQNRDVGLIYVREGSRGSTPSIINEPTPYILTEYPTIPSNSHSSWITENRTMSPEPKSEYDPNRWALVKYQGKSSGTSLEEPDEQATSSNGKKRLVTWKDEVEEERESENEMIENQWLSRGRESSLPRDEHVPVNHMQLIVRRRSSGDRWKRPNVAGFETTRELSLPARFMPAKDPVPRPFRNLSRERTEKHLLRRKSNESFNSLGTDYTYSKRVQRKDIQKLRRQSNSDHRRPPSREPTIITNDVSLVTKRPSLLNRQNLSTVEQIEDTSSSLNIESDTSELSESSSIISYEYESSSDLESSYIQHERRPKKLDSSWEREIYAKSPSRLSSPEVPGTSRQNYTRPRYLKRGRTVIPRKLISIQAVISREYPYSIAGDMVVLHKALTTELIDDLLMLSLHYKAFEEPSNSQPGSSVGYGEGFRSNPSLFRIMDRSVGSESSDDTPLLLPEITVLPFFCWKVEGNDQNHEQANSNATIVRLLDISHDQLQSNKLYNQVYTCTLDNLLRRHAETIGKSTSFPDSSTRVRQSIQADIPLRDVVGQTSSHSPGRENDSAIHEAANSEVEVPGKEKTMPVEWPKPCERLMKQLLELSQELLGAFVPKDLGVSTNPVCERFWGSLDEILRQIMWSAVEDTENIKWAIRNSTSESTIPISTGKNNFEDCEDCRNGTTYTSPMEALEHLHSEHHICRSGKRVKRPYDDPCYVWLKQQNDSDTYQEQSEIVDIANHLIDFIVDVKDLAMELHYFITTTPGQGHDSESRPFLPDKVFFAFQEILLIYLITAKHLSLINKLRTLPPNPKYQQSWAIIRSLEGQAQAAFAKACELLENSKGDIILSGTRSPGIIGVEAVGPQFLAAALMINLQNRPLIPKSKVDAVQVYREYTSKLRYRANCRPRRRVFLQINKLEEELEALQNVTTSQIDLLYNYRTLLSPDSFRITDSLRTGNFRIESRYVQSQLRKLYDRNHEIHIQRSRAKHIKEEVKQIIEILEEDHGKAIRVFTIVTIFFLPL
ncbi:hypothetical protein K445DRAFT_318771 [Daldinia sp. EC12]|nr:hypothetical protein K445DRAFT_318771 [Daldinia sp. EC12]